MHMNWNDYFIADFEAGTLTWKQRALEQFPDERVWKSWNTKNAGKIAGCLERHGYWKMCLFHKRCSSHRIIWEMANGPIPKGLQIDHIDQNRSNNRLSNLRLATNAENARNRRVQITNTSGFKGVSRLPNGSWRAKINVHGRKIHIGHFANFEEATAARQAAELKYHGAFAPQESTKQ